MLSLRNVLALLGTLALLIAAAVVGDQTPQSTHEKDNSSFHTDGTQAQTGAKAHAPAVHHDVHHGAVSSHSHNHNRHIRHTSLDAIALADIHNYASRHFNEGREKPHTFHAVQHWERNWELRWVDYDVSNHVVRIYHAVHKGDPALRFTSLLYHADGRYERWQPVE